MSARSASRQYRDVTATIAKYFREYGGWWALFASPFLHSAFVISCFLWPYWLTGIDQVVLAVVPSMLGFSLAAFALSLSIGSDQFRIYIGARVKGNASVLEGMSNAFLHFMLVQVLTLLAGVIAGTHPIAQVLKLTGTSWSELPGLVRDLILSAKIVFGAITTTLLVYAIVSVLPAIFHIYSASKVFVGFADRDFRNQQKQSMAARAATPSPEAPHVNREGSGTFSKAE